METQEEDTLIHCCFLRNGEYVYATAGECAPIACTGSLLLAVPLGHSLSFPCRSIYSWKHERTVPTPSQFLFTGALRITVMTEITSKQQEKNIFLNEQQLQENNYFFLSQYQAHIFPLLIIFHCRVRFQNKSENKTTITTKNLKDWLAQVLEASIIVQYFEKIQADDQLSLYRCHRECC